MGDRTNEHREPPQALEGIKVVELSCLDATVNFSAAMAGKQFADYGAEVIKIEPPSGGAPERHRGPFKDEMPDPETGGLHLYLNTNKFGVTLNLESERGRELLFRLLDCADIILNPNPPALSERLGIGWRTLTHRFPRLIAVSLTSFGAQSPYRNLRGGDLIATHMSGVGYETPINQVTDPPNQPPLKPAGRQADYLAGFAAAAAAMCALYHRKRTGAGQHVDASLWLAMISMIRPSIGVYSHDTPDAPYGVRIRTREKLGVPWVYPCQDGWVSFSPLTDKFWRGTKTLMGNPEWAENELFANLPSRAANYDAVEAALIEWLSTQKKQDVFRAAQAEHVPCFPVNTPSEVAENPQYKARGFFVSHDHPAAREVRMPGAPCIFSRTPWRLRRGAPRLGEHNAAILAERPFAGADFRAPARRGDLMGALPFEGIRIADFGWIFAIPHATAWLGSLGAEVIRIESTLAPDLVRFLAGTDGTVGINRSGMFNSINFSRKSLTLNLANPEAREIALKLVALSDIATENYTYGNMKKWGLSYEDLRRVRPDLIMLSGTPLGQTDPYASAVGFGPTTQAFAGMCHLTGYPGEFPCGIGGTWPDFAVGTAMVFFLLAALHHRDRTGEGQYLDVSMAETVTSMLPEAMMDYFLNWRDDGPIGNRDEAMAPHGVFPASGNDRWIAIAIGGDDEFAALCEALGAPSLAADPRYSRLASRLANVGALEREIAARTREFERDGLVRKLRERNLAAGPVYGPVDLMKDEAFLNSGMLVELDHPESGRRIVPGIPVNFSAMKPDYRPAPAIGQHTDELLSGLLGYSTDEIARLRENKVVI